MTPKPISGLLEQFCTNVLREKRLLWYPIQLEMVNSDLVFWHFIKNTPNFNISNSVMNWLI